MSDGKILAPDADGILVPTDLECSPVLLTENEKVLSLAVNSGGSGTGMSYYSSAARCGRKANLSARRYDSFAKSDQPIPLTKNAFMVGSVYHKLHELARTPNGDTTLDMNERWQNPNVAEGVRLFKGWLRHWGINFWGGCVAVEHHITDTDTFKHRVEGVQFDAADTPIPVTAAIDMVVEMDIEACERARRRGLDLEPGHYLIDWKTADGPSDGTAYTEGVQALWYCHAWNAQNPCRMVKGIIFDVVMKRSRRKDRNVLAEDFQCFYVPFGFESVESLAGMVQQGYDNTKNDRPNRAECVNFMGQVCPFRTSGECDGT